MTFKTISSSLLFAPLALVAFSGCNPYEPNLGNIPFRCSVGENPQCPEGYDCVIQNDEGEKFCVAQELTLPPEEDMPDNSGLICTPDDELANNDSRSNAVVLTPANSTRIGSICPNTDVDYYTFQVLDAGASLDVSLGYLTDFGELSLTVQSAGNVTEPVAVGALISSDDDQTVIRATASSLAQGAYYIIVSPVGTESIDENNYTITMNLQ